MMGHTVSLVRSVFWAIVLASSAYAPSLSAQQLELKPNDHICIIGNTLAERMQHSGWLEANIQRRFPQHQLVIRNLGFSGDTIKTRLRSSGFGSPDDHLKRSQADVVLMMFGFNESFGGDEQIETFKKDYDAEVKRMLQQQYSGKSPPRIALISPIACEDNPVISNRTVDENNARLKKYTQAIAEVAHDNQLPFVDLFSFFDISNHSKRHSEIFHSYNTFNGIHLSDSGDREISSYLCDALFGKVVWQPDELEPIRRAVQEKNFYWFNMYRTTDGYSIFGGRGELEFVNRQTNREVMTRELEILEVMTANRDPLVWAAANGKSHQVDDSNTPPFLEVKTNKPGSGPEGTHTFLSAQEAVAKMKILDGFQIAPFASEEQFPELVNPVQMSFDTRGRLWVAVWPSYPHWKPKDQMNDKLLILEDTNGDGQADKCTTFADGLHNPTGFEFYGGGVYVAQVPDVLFLKDVDGDDRCDDRQRVLHGIDSADTHHSINSFTLGPDGALYFQEGTFHHTQIETPYGPIRSINAGSFRFEPRTFRTELYTAYGYANPHGHVFDQWGRDIIHDGTGSDPYDAAIISGHLPFPQKHPGAPVVYNRRTRPCPATEFVSTGHFPESMNQELLVQNVIGDLGILRYKISEQGASVGGEELEPLLLSSDPNFRPVDLEFAPDGSLYLVDWHNPIIGHMQHNLRDPSRDKAHGRVYRITHKQNPLRVAKSESEQSIAELLVGLQTGDLRTRYRTRIELTTRDTNEVLQEAQTQISRLSMEKPSDQSRLLELLWLHQQMGRPNLELLQNLLQASDHRVRAASVRILTDWRHYISETPALLAQAAADPHPRVRLMAARGASFLSEFDGLRAIAVAAGHERDRYIDYVIRESMRSVSGKWRDQVEKLDWLKDLNPIAMQFVLDRLDAMQIIKLPMNINLANYLLTRAGIEEKLRAEALNMVSLNQNQSPSRILVDVLAQLNQNGADRVVVQELIRLLSTQPAAELKSVRETLVQFARDSDMKALRQLGFIGLAVADQNIEPSWRLALERPARLVDLATAMPLIPDLQLQHQLFPKVQSLISRLPESIADGLEQRPQGLARYVRIALPGPRRILTLAEVEVLRNGENLARLGTATQSSTSHSGAAARAIDGNRSGRYNDGGQTHTAETTADPWWELDLKQDQDIDTIRIFNRTDEQLGQRLAGFTLQVLDQNRTVLFQVSDQPAPAESIDIPTEITDLATRIRQAAIAAIAQVPGREQGLFEQFSQLILSNDQAETAMRAAQRLPTTAWQSASLSTLAETIVTRLIAVPVEQRGQPQTLELIQFGEQLAAALPPAEAHALRSQLSTLGVKIVRLGTKPHRMAFDKTTLVVPAGQAVVMFFENTDMMPHNVVITEPGSMQEIGEQAELESQQPGAQAKHYVPNNSKILVSSKLIQPQETQRLEFVAPQKPGIYPYVCTYPGHWRRMYGAMYVVASPADFQADPTAYIAANKLVIRDDLLALVNRTVTEWKLGDLSPAIASEFTSGRDYESGSQMFILASCISCHKMNDKGYELGPDLTKLDPKWTVEETLNHLLEPSTKIDDKYRTQIFQLDTGNVVSGVVVFEDDRIVRLVENPLQESNPTTVDKDSIEGRRVSEISIMPKGLLDSLSKEEILDLMAYLTAQGKPDHPIYSGSKD